MITLSLVALALTQPPQPPPARNPAAADRDAPAASRPIDGTWTVLCFERNGQPVAEAKDAKVNVRGNVVQFTGNDKMKAMRVEFGPQGTVRVTELATADGAATPGVTAAPDATRPAPPAPAPGDAVRPDPTAAAAAKSGVYVLTNEYLAICLHDDARPAPGAADTSRLPPAAADPANKFPPNTGSNQPSTTPPATPDRPATAAQAGVITSTSGYRPQAMAACTVILKRTGSDNR